MVDSCTFSEQFAVSCQIPKSSESKSMRAKRLLHCIFIDSTSTCWQLSVGGHSCSEVYPVSRPLQLAHSIRRFKPQTRHSFAMSLFFATSSGSLQNWSEC